LKKDYSKQDYIKQFTIRVQENLAKIERAKKFWENEEDVPSEIFDVLEEQKQRLLLAQNEFGNYISPENFEIVD
jgi:phosphoenolpyruvate carboxykinase (GTP)